MRAFAVLAVLLISAPNLPAGGNIEGSPYRRGEKVEIRGVVRMVGNEPFTRMTVRTAEGIDFFLPDRLRSDLVGRQGEEIWASGVIRIEKIRSADGKREIIEHHLDQAVIRP